MFVVFIQARESGRKEEKIKQLEKESADAKEINRQNAVVSSLDDERLYTALEAAMRRKRDSNAN